MSKGGFGNVNITKCHLVYKQTQDYINLIDFFGTLNWFSWEIILQRFQVLALHFLVSIVIPFDFIDLVFFHLFQSSGLMASVWRHVGAWWP